MALFKIYIRLQRNFNRLKTTKILFWKNYLKILNYQYIFQKSLQQFSFKEFFFVNNFLSTNIFPRQFEETLHKLKLARQNLGRVYNFRCRRAFVPYTSFWTAKLPSLKWKNKPKQLLGYLPFTFALPQRNPGIFQFLSYLKFPRLDVTNFSNKDLFTCPIWKSSFTLRFAVFPCLIFDGKVRT